MPKYRRIALAEHGKECWVCGFEEGDSNERSDIEVHHLRGWTGPEIAEALMPLCTGCHAKVHSNQTHSGQLGMVESEYRATFKRSGEESTGARLSLIDGNWHYEQSTMKTITFKVEEELRDTLDEEAEEEGYDSRSAYLRDVIENRHESERVRAEYEEKIEDLESDLDRVRSRLDAREERIEELEEQLARRSQIEEKIDTLAKREQTPSPPWPVRWYRWVRGSA